MGLIFAQHKNSRVVKCYHLDVPMYNVLEFHRTWEKSLVHKCECEASLVWIWYHNSVFTANSQVSWEHLNCCKLFVVNLWPEHSIRIHTTFRGDDIGGIILKFTILSTNYVLQMFKVVFKTQDSMSKTCNLLLEMGEFKSPFGIPWKYLS